ncbi:MAG: MFS transporter [Gammaproteobacteria bacterium]|nr:MFS transporter [Gammaproteobacteria bacterium]
MTAGAAHDPFAALRYPEFRNLSGATFLITAAILIQEVALGYELYRLTRDPLSLGFIGLAEAIPFMGLALFGGHLADNRERRGLMQGALLAILLGSLALWVLTLPAVRPLLSQAALLAAIYGVIFLLGLARGIYSPAASSLKAFLVPRELYPNSSAWNSSFWQAGAILGPVAAGFLYAGFGLSGTLAVVVGTFALAFLLISTIAPRPVVAKPQEAGGLWASLKEGLDYVFRTKVILYAISLDMFSVLFGGVVAILPVFAEDILRVGPEGLGVLRAAPAVGALLTMLLCAYHPPTRKAWRNLLWAVAGFGVATLLFAVSESFWLSAAMLFATGAFDSVSVIIRQTILQAMPPDHLRGRVVAVNSIFVSSSNELGAFESGLAAKLMGTVPSVLFGGAMTLATVGWIWRRSRELFGARLH